MCCIVVLPTAVETASRGRSLGKLALGLRVVRDDGGAIGFRHAFIRALTGVVEIYLTFGGLAVLVGFLNPSSKRLGDLLAGTHAQVERVPKLPSTAFGVPPELVGWAATPTSRGCPTRSRGASPRSSRTSTTSCPRAAPASPRRSPPRSRRSSRRCRMPPPELFLAARRRPAPRRATSRRCGSRTRAWTRSRRVLTAKPVGFPER